MKKKQLSEIDPMKTQVKKQAKEIPGVKSGNLTSQCHPKNHGLKVLIN